MNQRLMYALVIAAASLLSCCHGIALLAYSVHRHGARNTLPKTSLLEEPATQGGPALLPEGERMCYDAGAAYRARYLDPSTCGSTCLFSSGTEPSYGLKNQGDGFHNYNTLVRSSFTDRAIMSAQGVIAGWFPPFLVNSTTQFIPTGQTVMPVFTTPDEDDWLIRAYTKCNTYQDRLTEWYKSPAFQSKAIESASFRAYIQSLDPTLDTSLANWWNVYDAWNVYRTYGVGDPMPVINQTMFTQLVELANWLEISKMSSNLTGNMLGGPLLSDMLSYLDAAVARVGIADHGYYRLLSISSHYNVQLGLLSALKLDTHAPALSAIPWFTTKLPSLASQLVFELLSTTTDPSVLSNPSATTTLLAVRLVVQDGPSAPWVTVPLPCAVEGDEAEAIGGPGACTLANFRSLAAPATLSSPALWCNACNNSEAGACQLLLARSAEANSNQQVQALLQQLSTINASPSPPPAAGESGNGDDSSLRGGIIAGVVVTFFVTLGLSGIIFGIVYKRARQRWMGEGKPLSPMVHGPSQVYIHQGRS